MIGKITKGSGFGGVFAYILSEDKNFTLLPTAQQCLSDTPEALAREFQYVANIRSKTTKPVRHFAIGFSPSDGEIDNEIKAEIAVRVMEEMGFADSQYFAVAHDRDDPNHHQAHDHDHIHIVANAIQPNGEKVDHFWDYRKLERCLRSIEIEYGLQQLENSWEKKKIPKIVDRTDLQEKIDRSLENSPDLRAWLDRLAIEGVNVRFKLTNKGHVQGISYIHDSELQKGGDIDRSWRSIESQFKNSPDRLELMKAANLKTRTLPVILRRYEQEQLNKAANLAINKLGNNSDYQDKSLKILIKDGVLTVLRLRPAKQILAAIKKEDEWQSLGVPNIDKKDLQILESIDRDRRSPQNSVKSQIPDGNPIEQLKSIAQIEIEVKKTIEMPKIDKSIELSNTPDRDVSSCIDRVKDSDLSVSSNTLPETESNRLPEQILANPTQDPERSTSSPKKSSKKHTL